MSKAIRWVDAPARAVMSLLFLWSGGGKLLSIAATRGFMESYGVPGILLWPTALFEIGAGFLLVIGLWTRPVALLLAGFCLITAFIFHSTLSDQIQLIMFLKNLTMAGGFLLLAKSGAPGLSVDGLLSPRKRAR